MIDGPIADIERKVLALARRAGIAPQDVPKQSLGTR
jgi:hypothetical protein